MAGPAGLGQGRNTPLRRAAHTRSRPSCEDAGSRTWAAHGRRSCVVPVMDCHWRCDVPHTKMCTLDGVNLDDLPLAEFAFPGPVRDRLAAAILSGAKTSTSGLVLGYERANEPIPTIGQLKAVVDSDDRRVAAIELTEVRVVRLADVDLQHVLDEGEGDESVAQWRAGHESFCHSAEVLAELGDPSFTVNDDTLVLALRFRLSTPPKTRVSESAHTWSQPLM
jgi:uncharacterized protein YhfF